MNLESSYVEIGILIANGVVAVMNNSMRNKMKDIHNQIKISALEQSRDMNAFKAMIFETFLTKDDYYSTANKDK